MITLEKLRIFEKYNGDADGFVRTGTKSEKECLDNKDWLLIDCMIQDLQLLSALTPEINSGQAIVNSKFAMRHFE